MHGSLIKDGNTSIDFSHRRNDFISSICIILLEFDLREGSVGEGLCVVIFKSIDNLDRGSQIFRDTIERKIRVLLLRIGKGLSSDIESDRLGSKRV
jgi:hypothetical protein